MEFKVVTLIECKSVAFFVLLVFSKWATHFNASSIFEEQKSLSLCLLLPTAAVNETKA